MVRRYGETALLSRKAAENMDLIEHHLGTAAANSANNGQKECKNTKIPSRLLAKSKVRLQCQRSQPKAKMNINFILLRDKLEKLLKDGKE